MIVICNMTISLDSSSYDAIADEYYDSRHITSRNFDETTFEFCQKHIDKILIPPRGFVLEVGCGKGSANKYLNVNLNRVIQTDISFKMLKIRPRENSHYVIQCNATELPFQELSFSAVFAFLYDPYNVEFFYSEVGKVLIPGGIFVGTLPHFAWGNLLRSELKTDKMKTQFRKFMSTNEYDFVELDSYLSDDDQIRYSLKKNKFYPANMYDLKLPLRIKVISPHIKLPAHLSGISPYELPIVKMIVATKQ